MKYLMGKEKISLAVIIIVVVVDLISPYTLVSNSKGFLQSEIFKKWNEINYYFVIRKCI